MELSQNVSCSEDQVAQKASFLQALEWASEGWTKTPHSYEDFSDKDNQLIDEEAKNKYIEKLPQFHLLVFRNKFLKNQVWTSGFYCSLTNISTAVDLWAFHLTSLGFSFYRMNWLILNLTFCSKRSLILFNPNIEIRGIYHRIKEKISASKVIESWWNFYLVYKLQFSSQIQKDI